MADTATVTNVSQESQVLVLNLKILDGEQVIYQGPVTSISSVNEKGTFDVLERHENFITLIQESLTIRPIQGEEMIIPMKKGIMKVNQDQVTVFVGLNILLGKKEQKKRDDQEERKSVDDSKEAVVKVN